MTDNERDFEDFICDVKFDDAPDHGHRDRLEHGLRSALARQAHPESQLLGIRRIIMKSRIAKLATAAMVILAFVLSITILNRSASPAWAIEQSIEAVSQYGAIFVEGSQSERTWRKDGSSELKPSKSWAVANEDQTTVKKYRAEVDGVPIITTNGQKTWRYDLQTNSVHVENRPYVASECWFGSQLLDQLKVFHDSGVITRWEVTYGKDPVTAKSRAFLAIAWLDERYNGPRSLWLEFDMESKLLVSLKQWENASWDGPATLLGEKITYYENLPDDLFEFEIPAGATVIEE